MDSPTSPRQRGIAAVLAMMFLVIFGSLATAMAIVSQGNLHTADSNIKVQRAQAATETGMGFIAYELSQAGKKVKTRKGVVEGDFASEKWAEVGQVLRERLSANKHYDEDGGFSFDSETGYLYAGPIRLGLGSPNFEIEITPHPLPAADDDPAFYQSGRYVVDQDSIHPYARLQRAHAEQYHDKSWDNLNSAEKAEARATWQPDQTLLRVKVSATAGKAPNEITRSVSMDFQLDKKIDYAILAKSRIMIGQNVMIDGAIGSEYTDVGLDNGHPVQMKSDFYGLDPDTSDSGLDHQLEALVGTLITNDADGDNRINVYDPNETDGLDDPKSLDVTNDGYIDDYDLFLEHFGDTPPDKNTPAVEVEDLEDAGIDKNHREQIVELIDTFGDPERVGYNDGVLDKNDRYAKIRGEIYIEANKNDWESGAASEPYGAYQDYFKGPIEPDHNKSALTFDADHSQAADYTAEDFDLSGYQDDLSRLDQQVVSDDDPGPDEPAKVSPEEAVDYPQPEPVPYGAEYPYDYFARDVYKNMTFTDVRIPAGSNALFVNCTFIGVTYIETDQDNDDPNYNYAGMNQEDGSKKYPNTTTDDGDDDTKDDSNNIRFHDCTFEGSVIAGSKSGKAPEQYTHTRNKLAFTGDTDFADVTDPSKTPDLTAAERRKFQRSRLMAPNFSVEMGTFAEPANSNETVHLTGTIVAGLIDMRGQVDINGTLLTTFAPDSEENQRKNGGPVVGPTSPQFNTTLGYFGKNEGDHEAEVPPQGLGVIHVRHDPSLPLPDGINGPISIEPLTATYEEGGG